MESKGGFTQIGIVSYGYGCATEIPGVYTRLDTFTPWVRSVLANTTSTSTTSDIMSDISTESSQKPTPHFDFLSSKNGSDRNVFSLQLSFAIPGLVIMLSCLF